METLIKVDSEKHMYRWYSIGIQNTLVDGLTVIFGWGSLKSAFQQWRTIKVQSQEEGEKIVTSMLAKKLGNGYSKKRCRTAQPDYSTVYLQASPPHQKPDQVEC